MIETRRAKPDDAGVLMAHVQAGFESYSSFAPTDWIPPDASLEIDGTRSLLRDSDTWALIALAEDQPVGHVSFYPARERILGEPSGMWRVRPPVPGLAHLWQLFVVPEWWGRGVAPLLHDLAIEEMRAQGYERSRLYTPTNHARARRFYERRGWTAVGEEFNPGLAMMLTEYRLDVRG